MSSCGSGATSCWPPRTRSAAGVAFITAPPLDFVPEPVRGQPVVGVMLCYSGDPDEWPARSSPRCSSSGRRPSTWSSRCRTSRIQQLLDGANPKGMRNYWSADFLDEPARRGHRHPRLARDQPGVPADADTPRRPAAAPSRASPKATLRSVSATPRGTCTTCRCGPTRLMTRPTSQFTREISTVMKPWATGRVYLNYIGDEGPGRVEAASVPRSSPGCRSSSAPGTRRTCSGTTRTSNRHSSSNDVPEVGLLSGFTPRRAAREFRWPMRPSTSVIVLGSRSGRAASGSSGRT